MNFINQALSYLFTSDNWFGPVGLAASLEVPVASARSRFFLFVGFLYP